MQNLRNPVRVGLLLDTQFAPEWIHKLIEQLLASESVELSLIVLNRTQLASLSQPKSVLFRSWKKVDEWLFRRTLPQEVYMWLTELGGADDPLVPRLKSYPLPTVTLSSGAQTTTRELLKPDATRICAHNLDVLVQLGSHYLPDGISSCARYGVWAFHYEGYGRDGTDLALSWHLFGRRRTCELVLTASTGRLRRDRVLYRGIFSRDFFSLYRNLTLDCCRRSRFLLRRLSDLFHVGWANMVMGNADRDIIDQQKNSISLSRAMPGFLVSCSVRVLRHALARLCFREQWLIAYWKTGTLASDHTISDSFTVITPPRGHNYADPFLFTRKGKPYIFFEEFDDDGQGAICCTEIQADGAPGEPQRVLTRNYHLSYPFVFEWRGGVYLLPETWGNGTIEVYAAIEFPWRWELAAVLLRNVTAADPTIFEH